MIKLIVFSWLPQNLNAYYIILENATLPLKMCVNIEQSVSVIFKQNMMFTGSSGKILSF